MQISRRTDYGVRVILDLSGLPADKRASTMDIARRQNVPAPFLAKIISRLSVAGLVITHRGSGGGVTLARPPSEISLLEVVKALEGPVQLNLCTIDPDKCSQNSQCPVHPIWMQAQRQLTTLLERTTFDSLSLPASGTASALPAVDS